MDSNDWTIYNGLMPAIEIAARIVNMSVINY